MELEWRGRKQRQVICPKIVPLQKGRALKKPHDSLEEENNGKCTGSVAKTSRAEKKCQNCKLMLILRVQTGAAMVCHYCSKRGGGSRHISREVPQSLPGF